MGTTQPTLWRNLNKKSKTTIEKFEEILFTLGIKESDLYENFTFVLEDSNTNDELSVNGAREEISSYKSKVQKINNKDRTLMDQAEALKLANEQIGKLIDMNMKLIETISELNKKIDMKMILVCVFMVMSLQLVGQCKNRPKSNRNDDTAIIVAENVKNRIASYLVQSGATIDTTSTFLFSYDTGMGYTLKGNGIFNADTCMLFTNYDYDQKKTGMDLYNMQNRSSGKSFDVGMLDNPNASFSWDYFKCLLGNIPNIKFIKRQVPKF